MALEPAHLSPKKYFCLAAGLVGLAFVTSVFYPGLMSTDSFAQLAQARGGIYDDWHPPIMSWIWRPLDKIFPGPFFMLLAQNSLFWAGLSLLVFWLVPSVTWAPFLILFIGLTPPILGLLSTLWKDIGLGVALLLSVSLWVTYENTQKKFLLPLSLPFLGYAFLVRHNAPTAILPLIFWCGNLMHQAFAPRSSIRMTLGLAALIWIGLLGLSWGVQKMNSQPSHFPSQQIFTYDLVGISLKENQVFLPEVLNTNFVPWTLSELHPIFIPYYNFYLFCCTHQPRHLPLLTDPTQVEKLRKYWFQTLLQHPVAYSLVRWKFFRGQIGICQEVVSPFLETTETNSLGIASPQSPLFPATLRYLSFFKNSLLFRGIFYLTEIFGLLYFFYRKK